MIKQIIKIIFVLSLITTVSSGLAWQFYLVDDQKADIISYFEKIENNIEKEVVISKKETNDIWSITKSWSISVSSSWSEDISKDLIILKKENIVNNMSYLFNIKSTFKSLEKWEIKAQWNINILKWELLVQNRGLKQRLKIWSIDISQWENIESFSNIDIISNNENIYYKLWSKLQPFLTQFKFFDEHKKILESGRYIKINNSKPILDIIGELANDKFYQNLIIWAITSNPNEYYKRKGIYEKIKNYLINEKLINILFIQWEYNETTKKVNLKLNKNICEGYSGLISGILESIWWNREETSEIIEECLYWINETNKILSTTTQIYKKWDIEEWNYIFSLIQWNIIDINIEYKNHIISKWSIYIEAPDKSIIIKINWTNNSILSSLITININEEGVNISWKIENWNGYISIKWKTDIFDIDSKININKYILSSYQLNINTPDIFIGSSYEQDIFNISYELKNKEEQWSLSYNKWDIAWLLKWPRVQLGLSWIINSLDDYKIKITEDLSQLQIVFNWVKESELEQWHSMILKIADKKYIDALITISKSIVDWFNVKDINISIKDPNIDIEVKNNINFSVKKSEIEYIIPENIEEIDISLDEISPLPNFNEISFINKNKWLLVWWTVASIWWAVTFISLQWYSSDARNSKRTSDLGSIVSKITIESTKWKSLESFVIRDEKYEWKDFYVWWVKLIWWKNYFAWQLNYETLDIKKDEFSDPDWSSYIIWVTTLDWWKYQILSNMERTWGYYSRIKWNYHTYYKWELEVKKISWLKIQLINNIDSNKIKRWNQTNLWKVIKVSDNWMILTVTKPVKEWVHKIELSDKNSDWLIYNNWKAIIDGDHTSVKRPTKNIINSEKVIKSIDKIFSETLEITQSNSGFIKLNLGDIWITSFSTNAHNSKRSFDIWSIISKMTIEITKWISYLSFVNPDKKYAWKNIYLWWTKLEFWINYSVGTPNYLALDMIELDFNDPWKGKYLIATTTLNRWMYQLYYEKDNWDGTNTIKLKWNFISNNIGFKVIEKMSDKTIKLKKSEDLGYFKVGNTTNLWIIKKISDNWMILTLDQIIKEDSKNIYIMTSDTKSLFYIDWKVVQDWDIIK